MPSSIIRPLVSFAALILAPVLFAIDATAPSKPLALFDGQSLAGWVTIVRPDVSADPANWTVADGVIKCTGQQPGYLRTAVPYQNYKLTLEWRWSGPALAPDDKGRPRNRNSGVLLHAQQPDAIWPKCVEAQLMETNAGDIYVLGGIETAEQLAAQAKAIAAASPNEAALKSARNLRRVPRQQPSSEKPAGQWNTYEITCAGDTITLRVNGVEQNRATKLTATSGHIGVQSEGAPIEFRKITLSPLN